MKKISYALIISLILILAVFSSGLAALPGTGWWSALWVQNISGNPGTVSMSAYAMDGSDPIGSIEFGFDPVKSLAYDPGKTPNYPTGNIIGFEPNLPSGFEGSVVLSAGVPAASVSQIGNYSNGGVGGTGLASAMYQGVNSEMLAQRLLAPTIKHNYSGATTTMYVQAANTGANVTATYTMADGQTYYQTEYVEENRTFIFDPANTLPEPIPSSNCGFDTRVSPCYGSAVITSDQPIAGILLEHPHSGSPITFVQAIRLSTPMDESTIIYVPSVKNDFCGSTGCGVAGAAVMNVDPDLTAQVKITLTVTFVQGNAPSWVKVGDTFSSTVSIAPEENYLFSKYLDNIGGMPVGTMAAAVIESLNSVKLVGSSNDAKTQPGFPGQAKVKYSAFPDSLASSSAYAPMVKEFKGIFTGGATIQNVGDTSDYITIEYHEFGTDNVYIFKTIEPVPPGGAAQTNWVSRTGSDQFNIVNTSDWSSFSELAGKEFSVKAYTDTGQNIVIMVTENTPNGSLDISRYEGINLPTD